MKEGDGKDGEVFHLPEQPQMVVSLSVGEGAKNLEDLNAPNQSVPVSDLHANFSHLQEWTVVKNKANSKRVNKGKDLMVSGKDT